MKMMNMMNERNLIISIYLSFNNHSELNCFPATSVDKPKPTGNCISDILGIAPSAP